MRQEREPGSLFAAALSKAWHGSRRKGNLVPFLALLLAACTRTTNPSFPVSEQDATVMLRSMRADPRPLERPLIIAGGIHDPGRVAAHLKGVVQAVSDPDDQILGVSFVGGDDDTFDECRDHLIAAVQAKFPGGDSAQTVEVDVIGFSMGGLIARAAAAPRDDGPRLAICRLFTICTPHQGAVMADWPTLDRRVIDMRAGSDFLASLDGALADSGFDLVAYARLDDAIVGAGNTAPPGTTPWWVDTPPLSLAHLRAGHDPRILADIARRLRGEEPLTAGPPLPIDDGP